MAQHLSSDFALSIVSFHEQSLDAHNFINRARTNNEVIRGYLILLQVLQSFAEAFEEDRVLPFDSEAIAVFHQLRIEKIRISTMDLRIAAITISRNLVLLSRNISDFSKVPNLVIEDWSR